MCGTGVARALYCSFRSRSITMRAARLSRARDCLTESGSVRIESARSGSWVGSAADALVLHAAIGLHIIGVDGRAQRVVDDERLAVAGERKPIGSCDLIIDDDGLLGAGGQV